MTKVFITIQLLGFLIFMLDAPYLLHKNVEVDFECIVLNKRFGKSVRISFQEIRRVTIRESENSVGVLIMVVFGKRKNMRIIVSDLDDQFKMIDLIKQKGKELGFHVIRQDLSKKRIKKMASYKR